jgi:HK97 family phage portal protein
VVSLATRGNAYGFIVEFDNRGYPLTVEWLPPNEIYVDETHPTMPVYWWASADGYFEIPRERMIHIAWFTLPGRVKGLSPVAAFAASIGIGLSANDYGHSWFENGGIPPATFRNINKTISPEQAEEITSRLVSSIRSGRPLTYGSDWEFKAIEVNPEESQFIETMKLNATQMASIFGIPPELVGGESGGSLTYNNPEMNGLALFKFTINSWLTLIETCLSRFSPDGQFFKFNADVITRADLKTRYDSYAVAIAAGFLTIDEVRQLENRPPLPKPVNPSPVLVPVKAPNGNVPNGNPDTDEPVRFLPIKL